MATGYGDCRVPWDHDEDWMPSADEPPPHEEEYDQMPIPERGMSQTSGVFPGLYQGTKKTTPKSTPKKGGKKR